MMRQRDRILDRTSEQDWTLLLLLPLFWMLQFVAWFGDHYLWGMVAIDGTDTLFACLTLFLSTQVGIVFLGGEDGPGLLLLLDLFVLAPATIAFWSMLSAIPGLMWAVDQVGRFCHRSLRDSSAALGLGVLLLIAFALGRGSASPARAPEARRPRPPPPPPRRTPVSSHPRPPEAPAERTPRPGEGSRRGQGRFEPGRPARKPVPKPVRKQAEPTAVEPHPTPPALLRAGRHFLVGGLLPEAGFPPEPRDRGPQYPEGTACPYCGDSLNSEPVRPRPVVSCSCCDTPHHLECWEESQCCSTYACGSRSHR